MTYTVQEVIDTILKAIPGAPFAETVDTFKSGDPSQPVTGIATTFLASCEILQQAVDRGANFIITHEPTFYNHLDDTGWLQDDPVYRAKRQLIEDHGLAIWRFHDYWHRHQPDGILTGVLQALGWEAYEDTSRPYAATIPPTPLPALVRHLKDRLQVHTARVIGPPDLLCRQISLLIGAPGGEWQIKTLGGNFDVLVTGEINEWEVSEYLRDALYQGQRKALIILGHAPSEQLGMAYLVEWLHARLPGVPVTYLPARDPFRWE
jgi:putative NIF3 family GTP cyclohydrolase 1 type 2